LDFVKENVTMTTIVLTVLNVFRETALLLYQDALEKDFWIMITVTTLGTLSNLGEAMMAVLPIFKHAEVSAIVMTNVLLVLNASNETMVRLSPAVKVQGMEEIGIIATILTSELLIKVEIKKRNAISSKIGRRVYDQSRVDISS